MVDTQELKDISKTFFKSDEPLMTTNEIANSVDSGTKDELYFDENITFIHNYLPLRRFYQIKNPKHEEFPVLMNQEFIFGITSPFDEKHLSGTNNKEILQLVKSRVNSFLSNANDINFKLLFMDNFVNYSKEIGFENTIDLILPCINKITEESENVTIRFLQNLLKFVDFLYNHDEQGYKLINDQIIPMISNILNEKKSMKIMDLAADCLIEITKIIREDDRGKNILTIIIVMAHDDKDEDSRILAIRLFNSLAPIIGKELCEQFIVPQVTSFGDDPVMKVRKAIMSNFLNICNVASPNTFKVRLLPLFQKLSKDSIWFVRKDATKILPDIAKLCDDLTKSTVLIDIFKKFSSDSSKWVKIAAVQVIGQFIACLKKEDLTPAIFKFYLDVIEDYYENVKDMTVDQDIIYNCAYNFPAILYCYGAEYWDELKESYIKMCFDKEMKVKRSLANSLADVAEILGPEITEKDLLTVFEKFFKEDNEIKMAVFKNLPKFLKNLKMETRYSNLEKIKKMINIKDRWRGRQECSSVISNYSNIFDDDTTFKNILPVALNFCLDDVAEVRFAAAKNFSKVILQFLNNPESYYYKRIIKLLDCFSLSCHYNYRQLFVHMCYRLAKIPEFFKTYSLFHLNYLIRDKVVNVRFSVAVLVAKILTKKKHSYLLEDSDFLRMAFILKNDKNKNVSIILQNLNLEEFEIPIDYTTFSNHLFINKMNFIKEEFDFIKNLPLDSKLSYTAAPSNVSSSADKEKHSEEIISSSDDLEKDKLFDTPINK